MPAIKQRQLFGTSARVAFIIGLIAPLFSPITPWLLSPFALALLPLVYFRFMGGPYRSYAYTYQGLLQWLLVGCIFSGTGIFYWHTQTLPDSCSRHSAHLTGQVVSFPRSVMMPDGRTRQSFTIDSNEQEESICAGARRLQLSYWSHEPTIRLGDHVALDVILRPVPSQWNEGQLPDQARAAASAIHGHATVRSVRIVDSASSPSLAHRRLSVADRIASLSEPSRVKGIFAALLVGSSADITTDDWHRFRVLGLSHVLVISGLHIGLIYGIVWLLGTWISGLRPLSTARDRRWIALFALVGAALYAALAGLSIPTQRALIMLSAVTLTINLGWRTRAEWVLVAAVLLILSAYPFAVFSSGLWLSAGATGALLLLSRRYQRRPLWQRLILIQLGLTLLLAPLTLFWFGGTSVVALISNIGLVPIMVYWVIPCLMLVMLLEVLLGVQADWLWSLASDGVRVFLAGVDSLVEHIPAFGFVELAVTVPQFFALCFIALVALYAPCPPRGRLLTLGLCALVTLWPKNSDEASLLVFDVGQGLAVLWQEADQWLLYDTGVGDGLHFSQFEKVIYPYMKAYGRTSIDHLVISHADRDHSGGLDALKNRVTANAHWGFGGQPCRPGMRLSWLGESTITVLNGNGQDRQKTNASSCVLRIEYRGYTIILAGDIGQDRERDLVKYWRGELSADTLVVAHHGSKTSSSWAWLKWLRAERAIISAGYANSFDHPSRSVYERLQATGAKIVDTRLSGSIRITISPEGDSKLTSMRTRRTPFWLQKP